MSGGPESAQLREYDFLDRHFERVRSLVYGQLGIALADSKRELVYGRLARRLRALNLKSFDSYLELLERDGAEERQHFCNAITTNLTAFFRERHHFDFLAEHLLPALEQRNGKSRRLRIWSAGCSTGEEPYSIAMVIRETLPHLSAWDIRILATDIDTSVLQQARRGLYVGERLEKLDGARILRWFERLGGGKQYQVREELRRLITFNPLNLIGDWPMQGPFDVIFCRNVVIYFDRDTQRGVVSRMAQLQRNGDYLFLGHSESLLSVSNAYRSVGQTIHRKVG